MTNSPADSLCFTDSQVVAIAHALGDTSQGLTGREIEHLLASSRIADVHPNATKWIRLHNAFATDQNQRQHRRHILAFIRKAMKPERYVRTPERFEPMRANLNRALLFAGLFVAESGELEKVDAVATITDAQRRAIALRADLALRGIHPDVLSFCREELLVDDYFHAVLEAAKSVMEKIRILSRLQLDGAPLVDRALGGDLPIIAINPLISESEKSEQKGFANLVRGMIGMFRNTTAHAPRVSWSMVKEDAEDLFSLVSLIHRRLDAARVTVAA